MSIRDPLCQLPPEPPPGCCKSAPAPAAAPIDPFNSAGLPAIRYRIGNFTSFRRAMLNRVAKLDLMPGAANPFSHWREGTDGDYQTMFIELWAYLADILTFYQERIANEAFLPTATQRDSMARLAALVHYRPSPGSGASGLVAFTVEKNKVVTVPAGFRVGSKAQPPSDGKAGKPAAILETETAIRAPGANSAIPVSTVAPTNQFAHLDSLGTFFGPLFVDQPFLAATAVDLYGSAGSIFASTFRQAEPLFLSKSRRFKAPIFPYRPYVNNTTRTVVLKGVNTRLTKGDYLIAVQNEGDSTTEKATAHQVTSVEANKAADTTTIRWLEPVNSVYDRSNKLDVAVYAPRVKAGLFGNTAPAFNTLPATLTGTVNNLDGPFKGRNWDDSNNAFFHIPKPVGAIGDPPDPAKQIFLDAVYDDAKGTQDQPGWAVLMADGVDEQIFHVTDARSISKSAYAITSKVTRLIVKETVKAGTFPLRTTVVLSGSELLPLQNNLPLPEQLSGDTLILSGLHGELRAGQTVILQGNLIDTFDDSGVPITNAESRTLNGPPILDAVNNITAVTLSKALDNQYTRAGAQLLANVVEVTQGETVKDEILGSGTGLEFQTFLLKKSPLTYLPSTDPEGISAVESTLLVTVNGARWAEVPTLLESPADEQAFTTTQDESGITTVTFGDGFNGARPSTGKDNIHARYRKGLGTSGNVPAAGIQQLTDNLPGLQKVTNPQVSSGGADAENVDGIRRNAPAAIRAFSRAVSGEDYASLALGFPGVAKASAAWVTRGANLQAIPQPYVQLTVATADQVPLAQQAAFAGKLRAYIDQRRDPNVTLRIVDFTPVFLDLAVTVDIDDRYPRNATLAMAQAALNPAANPDGSFGLFAFERLNFGESIHLSVIYAALEAVDGVSSAVITTLRRLDVDAAEPNKVRDSIFIRPTEIAVIGNDPADSSKGMLTVNPGKGGFADQ